MTAPDFANEAREIADCMVGDDARTRRGLAAAIDILARRMTRVGLPIEEYRARRDAGQKHCTSCGEWKLHAEFNTDRGRSDGLCARCRECQNAQGRASYAPVAPDQRKPMGPARLPRRPGDKIQARARINADVRLGLRPNPNDLYCAHCGHKGADRRHEYHHVRGFAPEHHSDVLPLCTHCHHAEHED